MIDDPRFQTIVRVLFWGGLALTLLFIVSLVLSRIQSAEERGGAGSGEAVSLEEKGGRLVVPERDLPRSLQEKLAAPAIALLPSRFDGLPVAPVARDTEKEIVSAATAFIEEWDDFIPGERSYSTRLEKLVKGRALGPVAARDDVLALPDVCPENNCARGMEVASSPELRVADYDGQRAYVVGYGVVRVFYPRDMGVGELHSQAYGIVLYRGGRGWLVERAASETLESLESA